MASKNHDEQITELARAMLSVNEKEDRIRHWRLCDKLAIWQAAMLALSLDPAEYNYMEDFPSAQQPKGYDAVRTALIHATGAGIIETDEDVSFGASPHFLVKLSSVEEFLLGKGYDCHFFNGSFSGQQRDAIPAYLQPGNPCYAPKLAAAVEAWVVTTAEGKYKTEGTPKQLMEKWLRENANRFGLNKADGKLNEDGIGQITKIANWRPEGGASKTPGSKNPTTPKNEAKDSFPNDNPPSLHIVSKNPRTGS